MTIARRVFGILLWGFCLWLVISSLKPLMFQIRQTGDWEAALYDPVYYLPLAGAGLGRARWSCDSRGRAWWSLS